MSPDSASVRQKCRIDPNGLPHPELCFSVFAPADDSGFPISEDRPFVAQEQARRAIAEMLDSSADLRLCWLVGLPRSGRHTLASCLAQEAAATEPAEDQILLPLILPSLTDRWIAFPGGEGVRLAHTAERGLLKLQSDLLDSNADTDAALAHLAESWRELAEHRLEAVRAYCQAAADKLSERAAHIRWRLQNGRGEYIDDLDASLHRYRWGILAKGEDTGILCPSADGDELFGHIETRGFAPLQYCDHTTVSAGALLKARGGTVIADGDRLAQQPALWQQIKRTAKRGYIELSDLGGGEQFFNGDRHEVRIPIKASVFITITPLAYMQLAELDPDLPNAWPHKAEFADSAELSDCHRREFAAWAVAWARRHGKAGMAIDAIAALLYCCSAKAGHSERIDLQLGELEPILERAAHLASLRQASLIKDRDIEAAWLSWRRRASLLEEELQRDTAEGIIHIETDGKTVGQVNGLTVLEQPEGAFGRPQRITAVVFASKDGLFDIERECQNGGKLYSKSTMILNGFILGCIGGLHVWPLGVSVCLEQSYDSIDGDSASSAEAYAALSAIADVPIDQGIAVTGSIDQFGNVQAVGGIAEKVRCFFQLCSSRGLTGQQGVIIPRANLHELIFERELRESLQQGIFHIWAVEHVREGIEILTGLPMGKLRGDRYPKRSIMGKIQAAADEAER